MGTLKLSKKSSCSAYEVAIDDTDGTIRVDDGTNDHVLVDKTTAQTLTNKTLTSPILNTPTINGGTGSLNNTLITFDENVGTFEIPQYSTALSDSQPGRTWLDAEDSVNRVIKYGDGNTVRTVVDLSTTQTLTNKTLSQSNWISVTGGEYGDNYKYFKDSLGIIHIRIFFGMASNASFTIGDTILPTGYRPSQTITLPYIDIANSVQATITITSNGNISGYRNGGLGAKNTEIQFYAG